MGNPFNADSRASTRSYIINNDTGEKMEFQFNPESVPYSRSARYTGIVAPGMSYPLTQYSGGEAREFSFEVFYYDRPYSGKIDNARRFLEELLPPEYNTDSFIKPPVFMFAFGYFVKKCVLQQLQVKDEWLDESGNPIMTRFTLTVRQVGV